METFSKLYVSATETVVALLFEVSTLLENRF